jgi:hypothetical protein
MSSHMAGDDPAEARRQHGLVGEGRGRLLRQAGAARGYLAVVIGLGLAGTALILLQAGLLARLLAGAARGTGSPRWPGRWPGWAWWWPGGPWRPPEAKPRRCGQRRW